MPCFDGCRSSAEKPHIPQLHTTLLVCLWWWRLLPPVSIPFEQLQENLNVGSGSAALRFFDRCPLNPEAAQDLVMSLLSS